MGNVCFMIKFREGKGELGVRNGGWMGMGRGDIIMKGETKTKQNKILISFFSTSCVL